MRLVKPRTYDASSNHPSRSNTSRSPSVDRPDLPLRTSVSDLKRPDARQLLRQQLTGTFPEAARQRGHDSTIDGDNMGNFVENVKERLARSGSLGFGQHASAQSSSSTVDEIGRQRPSVSQEHRPIDVEAAINILQELRKNASPEELVALHRALLPTKDVETVQSPIAEESECQLQGRSSMIRRRSLHPPGFATRGGASGDPLRRQSENRPTAPEQQQQKQQSKTPIADEYTDWGERVPPSSAAALAALDLAQKSEDMRAATPSDMGYAHTGGFYPGTLRVTNGAPSPEPSSLVSGADDQQRAVTTNPDGGHFVREDDHTGVGAEPSRNSREEYTASRGLPSNHIVSQLQSSSRQSYRRSDSQITHSRSSIRGRSPLTLDVAAAEKEKPEVATSLPSQPTSAMPLRPSHRASAYSQEYMNDCELLDSPYGNPKFDHATRLSTVFDVDSQISDDGRGTPEDALSKLTGSGVQSRSTNLQHEMTQSNDSQSANYLKRPVQEKKADSGYSSDYSRLSLQQRQLDNMGQANSPTNDVTEKLEPRPEGGVEVEPQVENQSLYNFGEALKMPGLPGSSPAASPSPAGSEKKQSRFMALRSNRSSKRSSMPTVVSASTDTLASTASAPARPDQGARKISGAKPVRKLQKQKPASVKEKEKEKRRRSGKVEEVTHEVKHDTLPEVPRSLSMSFSQRLHDDPSTSHLEQTQNNRSQEALVHEQTPEVATPRQSSAYDAHRRSQSLGGPASEIRGRQHVKEQPKEERAESPERKKSSSIFNFRSRSRSRARSKSRARSQTKEDDSSQVKRMTSDDDLHDHSDFASVAASLGSSPYDISTRQFHRSATVQRDPDAEWHMQSPHAYGNGMTKAGMTEEAASQFARKKSRDAVNGDRTPTQEQPQAVVQKTSSQAGMSEEAARQLARKKSRDVVAEKSDPTRERPRMATPKSSQTNLKDKPLHAVAVGASSVEERFPGWNGKAANPERVTPDPGKLMRPKSYAESIPPLPELPADFDVKASKAEEAMQKKLNNSARSSPTGSKRNSGTVSPGQSNKYIKETVAGRKRQEEADASAPVGGAEGEAVADDRKLELLHPIHRPAVKRELNVAVRELSGSGSEESLIPANGRVQQSAAPRSVPGGEGRVQASSEQRPPVSPLRDAGDGQQGSSSQPGPSSIGGGGGSGAQEERVEEAVSPLSPAHDAQHPGWPGWEAQAKLWKQRRQSLGETLSKKPVNSSTTTTTTTTSRSGPHDSSPAAAPSIVVSRYVTPLGPETSARANAGPQQQQRTGGQRPDNHRGALHPTDDKENRPAQEDVNRTGSASTISSHATVATPLNERAAKTDAQEGQIGTTQTWHSPTTTVTSRSRGASRGRNTVVNPSKSREPIMPTTTTNTRTQGPAVQHVAHSSGSGNMTTTTTTTSTNLKQMSNTSRARSRPEQGRGRSQVPVNNDAEEVEATRRSQRSRSRAQSLARLNGTGGVGEEAHVGRGDRPGPVPIQSMGRGWTSPPQAQAQAQAQTQAAHPPAAYPYHYPGPGPTTTATTTTITTPSQPKSFSRPNSFHDRYSGGLDYNWHRGEGFAGSAGTRGSNYYGAGNNGEEVGSYQGLRKSVKLSERFGVDLGDVPVFIAKS